MSMMMALAVLLLGLAANTPSSKQHPFVQQQHNCPLQQQRNLLDASSHHLVAQGHF